MKHRYHPKAAEELISAALYYEDRRRGLGDEFLDEFDAGMSAILDAPNRWPEIETGIRRYRLDRFPYGLVYRRAAHDIIQVIAVMELHRKPGYWLERAGE